MKHKSEDLREVIRKVKELYPKRLLVPRKPLPTRRKNTARPNNLPI